MKSLLNKFASSFAALLSESTILDADGRAEDIRNAILEVLAPHVDFDAGVPTVWSRVTRAGDIQSLWYLRSDVLAFLAEHSDEAAGRIKLDQITEMFRGAMPESHMPRARRSIR